MNECMNHNPPMGSNAQLAQVNQSDPVFALWSEFNSRSRMQVYKSLCPTVTTSDTLVNRQTHRRQVALTTYTIRSARL